MASHTVPTVFVTRAAGSLGVALLQILVSRGCQVVGLARSHGEASRVRRAGAVPVLGDLDEAGAWQDEVTADWVFHLPPEPDCRHLTWARADAIAHGLARADARLLDTIASGSTRRIVYVAHATWYGGGTRPITEDETPAPRGWGRCFAPALARLDGYLSAGLPIVTALPGWMYGDVSWFRERVISPVLDGRRLGPLARTGPLISTIHVEDCARALLHLAARGEAGGRYFVVNGDPAPLPEVAAAFARAAGRPLRAWPLPSRVSRFLLGPVLSDEFAGDAVFANIRLRASGFAFRHPTLDAGMQHIVSGLDRRIAPDL